MRQLILGVVAGVLLPLFPAHADIQTDLNADQPMPLVFDNAISTGLSVRDTLGQVIDYRLELSAAAVCTAVQKDAEHADELVKFAISKGADAAGAATSALQCAPDQAAQIFAALRELGISEDVLIQVAMDTGVDPTVALEPTAAGTPDGGTAPADATPGQTGTAIAPPPFGSNTGGGGGSNASPD